MLSLSIPWSTLCPHYYRVLVIWIPFWQRNWRAVVSAQFFMPLAMEDLRHAGYRSVPNRHCYSKRFWSHAPGAHPHIFHFWCAWHRLKNHCYCKGILSLLHGYICVEIMMSSGTRHSSSSLSPFWSGEPKVPFVILPGDYFEQRPSVWQDSGGFFNVLSGTAKTSLFPKVFTA